MTHPTKTSLLETVDAVFVINLESRPDRRREMEQELARIDLRPTDDICRFFPAVRPEEAGPFPSVGARGCFLSHLGLLRQARDLGCGAVLILEDDASLTSRFVSSGPDLMAELAKSDWDIAYLGHRIAPDAMPGPQDVLKAQWARLSPETRVETAHAMMIQGRILDPLIAYLDAMLARPAGDPHGGPMHVDGAYSWFRRAHPHFATYITPDQCITQRASHSDIAPSSWKDRVPLISVLRQIRNRLN